jgi:nucleoside phosphorylase
MPVVDYLILTPLNEEFRYLRQAWPIPLEEERVGKIHFYRALHCCGSRQATVVAAAMMDMGQAWSGVFASEALRIWKPANVVHVGIAGTLDKDVSLGDVIVPAEVVGYDVGDAVDTPGGPDIKFRSTGGQTDFALLGSAHALQDNAEEYRAWQDDAFSVSAAALAEAGQDRKPSVHIGAKQILASGNFVVKSADFGDKLQTTLNHKITAVDMEAKGLFNAVRLAADQPATLILRGISDRADKEKGQIDAATKGAFRASSVRSAARYLAAVIDRRLRLDHADNAVQLLNLNAKPQREAPLIAEQLGLQSRGNNSLCIAFDPLVDRRAGAPRLTLNFNLTGNFLPNSGVSFALRQLQGQWSRVFRSSGSSTWNCDIERSSEPYELALAVVADGPPNGRLQINVQDEFRREAQAEVDLAPRISRSGLEKA